MATEKALKRIFCKTAKIGGAENTTLQDLLKRAVKKLPKAKDRTEIFGDNHTYRRLINQHTNEGAHGSFCGVMVSYEPGTNAIGLAEDDDATFYNIDQLAPEPTKDGKRREFLEGMLYFSVIGNHIAVMQSSAVRSVELERHLFSLINKAQLVPQGFLLALPDAIGRDIQQRVKDKHVKEVELGMPLVAPEPLDLSPSQKPPSGAVKRDDGYFTVGGLGLDVLKSLFPQGLDKFKLQDALGENIELSLRIKYRRTVSTSGQKVIDKLAMALRHQDGGDAIIHLNGGEEIKGDALKLSKSLRLPAVNGVVQPTEAFDEMAQWLHDLIKSGTVAP